MYHPIQSPAFSESGSYTESVSQIYLFTGENSYLLMQERHRWTTEFRRKYGDENCTVIEGKALPVRNLLDEISLLPFIAEKRLVVVDGIPKCSKEEVQAIVTNIHPQVILFFCEAKVDKRSSGAKELLTVAQVKEFAPLKRPQLKAWLQTFTATAGTTLAAGAEDTLIEFLGDDMGMLSNEIEKLAVYKGANGITKGDVESYTMPSDEGIVWRMTDLLCEGKRTPALLYAHRMVNRGGDAYGLWALLLSTLKNLILVHAAIKSGIRSGDIAAKTGIHPFVLRLLQPFAVRLKTSDVAHFLAWAVQADKDLKTGRYRATDEAPEEIRALVDQFILHCP